MSTKKAIHYLILIAIIASTYIIPTPEGLSVVGWHLFGVYVATIVAIILKPFALPVILLAAVAISSIIIGITPGEQWFDAKNNKMLEITLEEEDVLGGYKSGTTWLVFAAFAMSTAFVATGLGKRIAYLLIGKFGSTTLRLGYVNACLDLLISPAMPSVTARAGGIIFPIMNSVAVSLGSDPATSPRKAGRYLLLNTYMVVKGTGYLFLTAMAPNAFALQLMEPILHVKFDWGQWFFAASIPGLLCLLLTPLVVYLICPPELKQLDNKAIAKKGLEELGPMTIREKTLLGLFVLAVLSWALGKPILGLQEASTTAISIMALLVIFTVVSWDDLLKNKGAWNTLIWYGGILGLSSVLKKAHFFDWLSQFLGEKLAFLGTDHGTLAAVVILFMSVAIRYLFAAGGAYIAAMVPVFSAVGLAAGADPTLLALGLLFSNCYGGALTHYGSGPAPVIYGAGYNDIKSWWIVGAVFAFGSLLIHVTIGFAWWKALVGMGVL
ncbi:anion permease [Cardiobacterium hominis]|uniref:anion permease n=1 Tax=Cardiobacterium hominis TaxID=2718 RepID=UPI0028E5CD2E|nr:anion permease [Cardiobacterium hominis]